MILRRTRFKKETWTPKEAVRRFCVACVCHSAEVMDCQGDRLLGDINESCLFFKYRLGKGRPSVLLIKKVCLECMGGSRLRVKECDTEDCFLHKYRLGTNPNRQGPSL